MRGKKSPDKISGVDEKSTSETERSRQRLFAIIRISVFGGLAVCLCILIIVASHLPEWNIIHSPGYDSARVSFSEPASTTYQDLSELLDALKDNEFIPGSKDDSITAEVSGDPGLYRTISLWDKIYSIDTTGETESNVLCFDPASDTDEPTLSFETNADSLFICGSRLGVVHNSESSSEMSKITIYDVYNLSKPRLSDTIEFTGKIISCGYSGNILYVIFSGRKPASEYRGDTAEFLPNVTINGNSNSVSSTAILGEPKTANWTSVAVFSTITLRLKALTPFFGDIENIYVGQLGTFSFETRIDTEELCTQSVFYIYQFYGDAWMTYHGKISLADVFGINTTTDNPDATADIRYVDYVKMTEYNGFVQTDENKEECIRLIGSLNHSSAGNDELFAIEFKPMTMAKYSFNSLRPFAKGRLGIDEVTPDSGRYIVTVSSTVDDKTEAAFVNIAFSGIEPYIQPLKTEVQHVDDSDKDMMPIGDGKYLRMRKNHHGLDLYDISDNVSLIAENVCKLGNGEIFETTNLLYPDGEHFGIALSVKEKSGYSLAWRIYQINENKLTQKSQTVITKSYDPEKTDINIVQFGNDIYYVTTDTNRLVKTL